MEAQLLQPHSAAAFSDAVEVALADAIARTSDPATLLALTAELKSRREARSANVVSLDSNRRSSKYDAAIAARKERTLS